jgi:lysine 2,3-aminomutase
LVLARKDEHDIMGYLPGYATPRIVCDVPFVGKRTPRMGCIPIGAASD